MYTLNCRGTLLTIERPLVMGIINITPDSFYAGSRVRNENAILERVRQMTSDGASIIDIGGQSTRPGSREVNAQDELDRVIHAIELIHSQFPGTILSIDTYYSEVALHALEAGASIVNDVSGGMMDPHMLNKVAAFKAPFICMHMKGTPQTMQSYTDYGDLESEIIDYFIERIAACRTAGIVDIILDPGFGFSKTIDQNFQLLKNSALLNSFELPWLAGLSRKGMIYRTLKIDADASLNGTTVLNTIALQQGASVLRVHDVKEAVQAVNLMYKLQRG